MNRIIEFNMLYFTELYIIEPELIRDSINDLYIVIRLF